MVNVKGVTQGAQQLAKVDGAGGVIAGAVAAPFARSAVAGIAPTTFEQDAGRFGLLAAQGVAGGMMAAGRLGRGRAVRMVGLGVAADAGRGLLERLFPALRA